MVLYVEFGLKPLIVKMEASLSATDFIQLALIFKYLSK